MPRNPGLSDGHPFRMVVLRSYIRARLVAVGFLEALDGAGVLDVLDGVAHLVEQRRRLSDLSEFALLTDGGPCCGF